MTDFQTKYLKYKKKYLNLKKMMIGGNICEGKKIVIAEAPDFNILLDNLNDNPLLVLDNKKSIVPHLFWKKILKMMIDCFYESIIYQYKQAGKLTDEKLESLNLLNDKDFLKKKMYNLKHSDMTEYREIEIIAKFIKDFYFVFTGTKLFFPFNLERKMYILVEEPKVLNDNKSNNYKPLSMLTVWNHNPTDMDDECDYFIGNFCTTLEKRGKGCGTFLLENILQKLKGKISLEVDKDNPMHNIKSHDSLVKYYKKFGFKVWDEFKDTTLMKKLDN